MNTEVAIKNSVQVTEALRQAAKTNKALHDICLVFAMRERTRFQVNVGSLRLTMAREGYHLSVKQIEEVLTLFASLGIGKLQFDAKKRLKGLTEVKWTLQSIGQAALGESATVKKSEQQRRYSTLPASSGVPAVGAPAPLKASPNDLRHQVYLSATVHGREVKYPLPMLLTSTELVELMADLNKAGGH